MTNINCNNCGKLQKVRIYETTVPYEITSKDNVARFFIQVIEKCQKCGQKKIFAIGINYLGHFVKYGFVRTKHFSLVEKRIINELYYMPTICRDKSKGSWYLYYNEHGIKKKCYSNLSSLKLGLQASRYDDLKERNLILRR